MAKNAFLDPVPITIKTAKETFDVLLTPTSKESITTVRSKERPMKIEIDPRNTILKEVSVRP